LAHVFQYARKAQLSPDTYGPLTEFLADAISVLEFNLLQISSDGMEPSRTLLLSKHRYAFAFREAPPSDPFESEQNPADSGLGAQSSARLPASNLADDLLTT